MATERQGANGSPARRRRLGTAQVPADDHTPGARHGLDRPRTPRPPPRHQPASPSTSASTSATSAASSPNAASPSSSGATSSASTPSRSPAGSKPPASRGGTAAVSAEDGRLALAIGLEAQPAPTDHRAHLRPTSETERPGAPPAPRRTRLGCGRRAPRADWSGQGPTAVAARASRQRRIGWRYRRRLPKPPIVAEAERRPRDPISDAPPALRPGGGALTRRRHGVDQVKPVRQVQTRGPLHLRRRVRLQRSAVTGNRRRAFGSVRRLPSGRWQARFVDPSGEPETRLPHQGRGLDVALDGRGRPARGAGSTRPLGRCGSRSGRGNGWRPRCTCARRPAAPTSRSCAPTSSLDSAWSPWGR